MAHSLTANRSVVPQSKLEPIWTNGVPLLLLNFATKLNCGYVLECFLVKVGYILERFSGKSGYILERFSGKSGYILENCSIFEGK